MDDASILLLKIYAGGFTLGVLPFFGWVMVQRRLKMPRMRRAAICAAVASITATPVLFASGWLAVFLPVSLGYWLAPGSLEWTVIHVIPETPWIHACSSVATAIVGFLVGWYVKPWTPKHASASLMARASD